MVNGKFCYQPSAQDIHCLFGWLQVGAVYHPGMDDKVLPEWTFDHPHVQDADYYRADSSNNTLYVASQHLCLPGLRRSVAGGGIFPRFSGNLQLTAPGHQRSTWRLPDFFYPTGNMPPLSYHVDPNRWSRDKKGVILRTVGRGQEFVLDCDYYPKSLDWIKEIFKMVPTISQ